MVRFLIDESSWELQGLSSDKVEEALEALLNRLETAKHRHEEVVVYDGFYAFDVVPKPFELLFETTSFIQDRDLRTRVLRALDRLSEWTDEPALDVTIAGKTILAPSIAYAHHLVSGGRAVACLPLTTANRSGPIAVLIDDQTKTVHFVTDERAHLAFFRDAMEVENTDERTFPTLAQSAFPELAWADGVWQGVRNFSKPFHDLRTTLHHHLGVLNDHARSIFRDLPPSERTPHLGSHGVTATGENGPTMSNAKARKDRTRSWHGSEHVFWWHTKFHPAVDRIHFLYHEQDDIIVIGLFAKHCYLPG